MVSSTREVAANPLAVLRPFLEGSLVCFSQQEVDKVYIDYWLDPELQRGMQRIKYGAEMLVLPEQFPEGWYQWLEEHQLDDPSLTRPQLFMRYQRFSKLQFPLLQQSEKVQCMHDLLLVEQGLVYGSAIGLVEEFPFVFKVRDNAPIKQRPIPYAKQERAWIRQYLSAQ